MICAIFTGPPTHSVGGGGQTSNGRWRLSSSVTRCICNVTHHGAASGGSVVLRPVRATPCITKWIYKLQRSWQICHLHSTAKCSKAFDFSQGDLPLWTPIRGSAMFPLPTIGASPCSSSNTAPSLRQISLWAKPTHVITLLVVLADWFGVLLSLAEHRFVEIGLRHSAVVGHVVASHHVRTSDPADRLVVKSRWRRIQDNPPFAVDSTVSLEKQVCRSSLLSGRNVCWPRRMLPLVSHDEYADGTDGRTPDRYVALSVGRGQHNKWGCNF